MCRGGNRVWTILAVLNGQLLPHYTIEFRKHFTQFHATVVEMGGGIEIGATECCMIMYGLQWLCTILPGTNTIMGYEINVQKLVGPSAPDWTFFVGDLVAFNTLILSVQYNYGNLKAGF